MTTSRILVVEDDENLRTALVDNLEDEGYAVAVAGTHGAATREIEKGTFDLAILDIMLPDGDGYDLCRMARERDPGTRILMLTARTLEDDLVKGFDAGADDYLTKPYRLRELLARVQALLRRGSAPVRPVHRFGSFVLDPERRSLEHEGGADVALTKTEFDLLAFFLDHEGRALTRDEILDAVWGQDVIVDGRTVDNFVSSLKKKLGWTETAGFRIRTIRGVGYRMEVEGTSS